MINQNPPIEPLNISSVMNVWDLLKHCETATLLDQLDVTKHYVKSVAFRIYTTLMPQFGAIHLTDQLENCRPVVMSPHLACR